jgi:peptidoglycan/LPS O-acetylase OafA/YrhL
MRTLITFILIPGAILYLATHGRRVIRYLTPKADLSYGIYLWGPVISKTVSRTTHPANGWMNFTVSLAAILPFALISWYLVEKPALSLKDRVK